LNIVGNLSPVKNIVIQRMIGINMLAIILFFFGLRFMFYLRVIYI